MATNAALTARQLAELHRVAQERLGLTSALITFSQWQQVNVLAPSNNAAWFARVVTVATSLRKVSKRLSARYYSLARALGTGHALPDIDGNRSGPSVTMGDLYADFAAVLNEVIEATGLDLATSAAGPSASSASVQPALSDAPGVPTDDRPDYTETVGVRIDEIADRLINLFEEIVPAADSADWAEDVAVDLDWVWEEFEAAQEAAADTDFQQDLFADIEAKAVRELEDIVRKELAADAAMNESMQRITDAARNKGAGAAATADQHVIQGGRDLIVSAGSRDRRRTGWMRVTGPNPCGFCAMLASRGAVYSSAASAGFGNLYHPNCHCTQVPVFTNEPYYSARDKFFIDSWKSVIAEKFFGKEALRQWRSWLARQFRAGNVPDANVFGPARGSTADPIPTPVSQ